MANKSVPVKKILSPLQPAITSDMVNKLQQTPEPKAKISGTQDGSVAATWRSPQLMIVFEDGDLHSARQHLLDSLQNPFAEGAVATVLLQESVRDQFVGLVAQNLKRLEPQVASHPSYVRTLAQIEQLKAKVVKAEGDVPADASPLLVSDFSSSYLGQPGPTGAITLHTFRTAREATQVNVKESVPYARVSIWNEKLACAYEVLGQLAVDTITINCFNPDLSPIQPAFEGNRNDVCLVKGYHYETLTVNSKRRIVVFPVGTIFAN
ncbi:uncharacterized protein LOC117903671 [Drosophila subobscura]|uniref:uncharacterized protein LOC117903671 n=1 Tax=Drosophila subobscura TaxID=7241 RepID=UPI00155A17D7|nr:uncharacterized protein LOC117903671 [Drosophila subobscura]